VRRRLVLVTLAVGAFAATSAPALAAPPPVPVYVYQTDSGVCFTAFSWRPNCVPTDFIR
jgi:hypothetical protein